MNTQCPNCQRIFDIPEPYISREIKCEKCHKPFIAKEYKEVVKPAKPAVTPKFEPIKFYPSGVAFNITGVIIFTLGVLAGIGAESCILICTAVVGSIAIMAFGTIIGLLSRIAKIMEKKNNP